MRGATSLTVTLLLAVGCVADPADPDDDPEPIDGVIVDPAGCQAEFGRTFIISRMRLLEADQGMDLDGDGIVDNALSFLRNLANLGWSQSIANGASIYLWDITPGATSTDALPAVSTLTFYDGIDTDGDPANNVGGSGRFRVAAEQFDVDCQPSESRFDETTVVDGFLQASSPRWSFFMDAVGTIELEDIAVDMWLDPDMSGFYGVLGGTWSLCSLSRTPFPGAQTGSFLDRIANGDNPPVDVDRDGDGLERILGNGETVQACIDGDGTEIQDPFCACDPRIADAYSLAIEGDAVPAEIIGVVDTTP